MARASSKGKHDLQKQLFLACQKGTWQGVLALLKKGASLSECDSGSRTALHHACLGNNRETARRMRAERYQVFRACLEKRCCIGETPLLLACRLGHGDLVEMLFREKPPEFSMTNSNPDTPLHVACLAGHLSVVRLLLRLGGGGGGGGDVNVRDRYNDVPLYKAIRGNHPDVVRALLEQGAEVNGRNDLGHNALHVAVLENRGEILELLLQMPILAVDAQDHLGFTPLHVACTLDHLDSVNRLLDRGADPGMADMRRFTPLLSASCCGYVSVVESLLTRRVDVNVVNNFRDTALSLACRQGHTQVVRVLLDHGADLQPPLAVDPVAVALSQERGDIAQMLLNHFATMQPG